MVRDAMILIGKNKWFWGLISVFLLIGLGIVSGMIVSFDAFISTYLQVGENTSFYRLFAMITELGSSTFLTIGTVVFAVVLYIKGKQVVPSLMLIGTLLFTSFFNGLIKNIVERPRPMINPLVDAHGYSFPSGHAMASIVAYGLVTYFFCKWDPNQKHHLYYKISGGVIIFLIGYSRVVLSAHYVFDVLAGFALGGVILLVAIQLFESYFKGMYKARGK